MHQAESKNLSESLEIIMAILSNYTPQCLVKCTVACDISNLELPGYVMSADVFVHRFEKAVLMAHHDVSRAVTHNKGIFNGVDAVIMATGNDFRAVEAGGHAWACKDGSYQALSEISIHQSRFEFSLELPMAVGVVGGLTSIHPLAKASLQLLGNPGADVLMSVAASAGMANHFSAIKALITGGIQRGHMKLHLVNILSQLNANPDEKEKASRYFRDRDVSFSAVKEFLSLMREM
jgi:hydroxymethylglutaryl-CoA reductase